MKINNVKVEKQPAKHNCWQTAAEGIYEYFRKQLVQQFAGSGRLNSLTEWQKSSTGKKLGEELLGIYLKGKGLMPEDTDKLKYYGLVKVNLNAGKASEADWSELLIKFGPLFFGGDFGFGFRHAVVIDGADTGSIHYQDPDTGEGNSVQIHTMNARLAKGGTLMVFTGGWNKTMPQERSDQARIIGLHRAVI